MRLQNGSDIRAERNRRDMNQDELASLLEISIHALIDIERGAPLLTPELRRKAREVFREHDNAAGAAA